MRLLHTKRLQFEEFYDNQIPRYAILSHRWASVDQEVSYAEFKSGDKERTSGYAKILNFCSVASRRGLDYCWVDTCCIDKTSSAELSEAVNSMFEWYHRAAVCFVYLQDISDVSKLSQSEWFSRGWTLQELIAPRKVEFFDKNWQPIATSVELQRQISEASGIDKALLAGNRDLDEYSIAQKMSWAARRHTSRLEDQAYCLLGLFDIKMPLLYGEGGRAFGRLQEEILAKGGNDYSLFAWDYYSANDSSFALALSILAQSPSQFQGCGNILPSVPGRRILFELTHQGMMVLIHRSYNPEVLRKLLRWGPDDVKDGRLLGLTIPLACYVWNTERKQSEGLWLQLVYYYGSWYRIGLTRQVRTSSEQAFQYQKFPAYENDYVRIYIHHDGRYLRSLAPPTEWIKVTNAPAIHYLHLRGDFGDF